MCESSPRAHTQSGETPDFTSGSPLPRQDEIEEENASVNERRASDPSLSSEISRLPFARKTQSRDTREINRRERLSARGVDLARSLPIERGTEYGRKKEKKKEQKCDSRRIFTPACVTCVRGKKICTRPSVAQRWRTCRICKPSRGNTEINQRGRKKKSENKMKVRKIKKESSFSFTGRCAFMQNDMTRVSKAGECIAALSSNLTPRVALSCRV